MSDSVLNELKRRWKATGDSEDHAAYLAAALRAGRMDPNKLSLLVRARAPESPAIEAVLGPVNRKITSTADGRAGEDVVVADDYSRWIDDSGPDLAEVGSNTFFDLIFDDWGLLLDEEKVVRTAAAVVVLEAASELFRKELVDGRRKPMTRRRPFFRHELNAQEEGIRQIQQGLDLIKRPDAWRGALLNALHSAALYVHAMDAFGVYRDQPDYVDEMIAAGDDDLTIEVTIRDDDRFVITNDWPAENVSLDRQTRTVYCVPPDSIIWSTLYRYLFKRLLAWLRDETLPAPPPLRTWI